MVLISHQTNLKYRVYVYMIYWMQKWQRNICIQKKHQYSKNELVRIIWFYILLSFNFLPSVKCVTCTFYLNISSLFNFLKFWRIEAKYLLFLQIFGFIKPNLHLIFHQPFLHPNCDKNRSLFAQIDIRNHKYFEMSFSLYLQYCWPFSISWYENHSCTITFVSIF